MHSFLQTTVPDIECRVTHQKVSLPVAATATSVAAAVQSEYSWAGPCLAVHLTTDQLHTAMTSTTHVIHVYRSAGPELHT